jgi:NTE family protein
MSEKRIHVVLGGGGSKCVAYVGALRALSSKVYRFESVSACSAGTVIAALVCSGRSLDEIEKLILKTDFKQFVRKRKWFFPFAMLRWPYALCPDPEIRSIVRDILTSDPELGSLRIPFATVGVDLVSNRFVVYSSKSHATMPLSEAVSIATAVPFIYAPYQKGGRIIVDAAVATQCPIWLTALQEKMAPIIALTCSSERSVKRPSTFGQYLGRIVAAGAEASDQAILAVMPQLHRIVIRCPEVRSQDFGLSDEVKRGLMDAGEQAIKEAFDHPSALVPVASEPDAKKAQETAQTVINNFFQKEVHMNPNINVGGNAIINIDSILQNVNQSIGANRSLAEDKKDELKQLVEKLQLDLDALKNSHVAEAGLIAQNLQTVVNSATQQPEQRNKKVLEISSKGLIEAAETVGKIAPGLLATAKLIGQFVLGL